MPTGESWGSSVAHPAACRERGGFPHSVWNINVGARAPCSLVQGRDIGAFGPWIQGNPSYSSVFINTRAKVSITKSPIRVLILT